MSDNQEIRFARLERAPAYKNVSEAILKDIIDGRLTVGNRLPSEQPSNSVYTALPCAKAFACSRKPEFYGANSASGWW
jgi:hypothetical protein